LAEPLAFGARLPAISETNTKEPMKNQIVAYATFSKLGIDKLTAEFTSRENSLRRIFSELGKVFTAMIPQIPTRGQTITAYLKDKGISQGTISNAQYASNAFALVVNGVITESRYDSLTLRECQTISKVGAEKSTAAFANRTQWRLELASLEKYGMTLAEHAADMAAKEQSKATESSAPAPAETPAETPTTPAETEAEPEVTATPTSTPAETPATPENVVAMPTNADPASVQSALQDRALVLLGELDSILAQAADKTPILDLIAAMVEMHAAPKARKRKAA
jgi:hypothetical protein